MATTIKNNDLAIELSGAPAEELGNENELPVKYSVESLPTLGKLFDGATEITAPGTDLLGTTVDYVPTLNLTGSDGFDFKVRPAADSHSSCSPSTLLDPACNTVSIEILDTLRFQFTTELSLPLQITLSSTGGAATSGPAELSLGPVELVGNPGWTPADDLLPRPRSGHESVAVTLFDGTNAVLSIGGDSLGVNVDVYDQDNDASLGTIDMQFEHGAGFTATKLQDGRVLVVVGTGPLGADGQESVVGAEIWRPSATVTNCTNTDPIVVTTAEDHGFLDGQEVTITGVLGNTACNVVSTTVLSPILSPITDKTFTIAPDLLGGNLGDYLSGGRAATDTALLGSFTATDALTDGRDGHTATLLPPTVANPNGTVLIASGRQVSFAAGDPRLAECGFNTGVLGSAEIFDPAGNDGLGKFNPGATGDAFFERVATLVTTNPLLDPPIQQVLFTGSAFPPGTGNFGTVSNDVDITTCSGAAGDGKIGTTSEAISPRTRSSGTTGQLLIGDAFTAPFGSVIVTFPATKPNAFGFFTPNMGTAETLTVTVDFTVGSPQVFNLNQTTFGSDVIFFGFFDTSATIETLTFDGAIGASTARVLIDDLTVGTALVGTTGQFSGSSGAFSGPGSLNDLFDGPEGEFLAALDVSETFDFDSAPSNGFPGLIEGSNFNANVTPPGPLVVTTSPDHVFPDGEFVTIMGVEDNDACNVTANAISFLTDDTFELNGTTGDGAVGTGGTAFQVGCAPGFAFAKCLPVGSCPTGLAELYDPTSATPSFGPAATPHALKSHTRQTATLLADGRVLVAGGVYDDTTDFDAEIYDPVANTWTCVGDVTDDKCVAAGPKGLQSPRQDHSAALLSNNSVLLTGGFSAGETTDTTEIFDPAAGDFTAAASMSVARQNHASLLLGDGSLMVTGGSDDGASLKSVEFFNLEFPDPPDVQTTIIITDLPDLGTLFDGGVAITATGYTVLDPSNTVTFIATSSGSTSFGYSVTSTTGLVTTGIVDLSITNVLEVTQSCIVAGRVVGCSPIECDDGVDNDGDGDVDFPADSGCSSAIDDNEKIECADGVDNDDDGDVDFPMDSGCSSASDDSE